jgi:hypothetical protein
MVSLSSVAIQTANNSRVVAAAGTLACVLVGAAFLMLSQRMRKFTPLAYFVWIFGAFNILNSGYLVFSAATASGDWTQVILGLSPAWAWRFALGLLGIAVYAAAVRWIASIGINFVKCGEIAMGDRRRLVWPAYLAGGAAVTIASIFNPIGPTLILMSGVGASFGLNFGLLLVPGIVAAGAHDQGNGTRTFAFSLPWLALGLCVSGIFIGVLGPGVQFAN